MSPMNWWLHMADKRLYRLVHNEARRRAAEDCRSAPDGWIVTVSEPGRTLDQNAAQWPYLEGFAQQKELCINGAMVKATPDDWKDVLTGCYTGETRMAVFDGRVIMLPQRTSKMGKKVFCDWMEFLIAMAAQSGVHPVYKSPRPGTYIPEPGERIDADTGEILRLA